ncbi:putative KAT8 regulatory NSL complex subunit 3/Testis-expressed sequence 30 protein [Helianthus annuus]|nr:putative KAT8 regulatory NSL complex subunit 3/Testis-expressed sequence 30 protein [Helianthus annuus]
MSSKRSRTPENEYEQAIQLYAPLIKRPEPLSAVRGINRHSPVVVFAHGAGAPSSSEWMIRWKNLLANALNAVEVVTFDYPYINGRRKAAPKPEKLVGFHSDIVRNAAAKYPGHPLILAGKSLGSRISCMVAAENDIDVSAVVCLGYPLKATNGVIRDEPLLQLTVPIMFVQGGNDGYCPLQSLETVRKKLKAINALHVIENGDHSFQIAKKNLELTGMTHEEAEGRAVEAVAMFVSEITGEKVIDGRGVIVHE